MRGAAQAVALLLVCALAAAEESDGTVAVCGTGPLLPAFFALLALLAVSAALVRCGRCVLLLMLRRLVCRLLS